MTDVSAGVCSAALRSSDLARRGRRAAYTFIRPPHSGSEEELERLASADAYRTELDRSLSLTSGAYPLEANCRRCRSWSEA